MGGDGMIQYTRFTATELDPSALKVHQERLGETEHSRGRCLEELRESFEELDDLEACVDEAFLLRFLRVESFDVPKAFARIKRFYEMQEEILGMFEHSSIPASVVQKMPYFWALPYRASNNAALLVVRMGVPDFSLMTFYDKCYLDLIAMEDLLRNPITQMCGASLIFDWSGFRLASFLAFRPLTIIRLMNHLMNTLPLHINEIHVVNAHSVFRILYNIFYFAMPEALGSRVFFHPDDNWKGLHGFIPPQILPEEYGGRLEKSTLINLLENARELEGKFSEQFAYGYAVSKQRRMSLKLIVPDKKRHTWTSYEIMRRSLKLPGITIP